MSASDAPPSFNKSGHAAHCKRCATGLPGSMAEIDSSRMALSFYCLGTLDVLGLIASKTTETDRECWREWIWAQQARGRYGSGFRPSPFMNGEDSFESAELAEYDDYSTPNMIMTYTAIQSLSILRDDFARLDRPGIIRFIRSCQEQDGSFSTTPGAGDSDLRMSYCAFAISSMLDDWSGIDLPRALTFIKQCRTYEGGYGQAPHCEAQGGTTYCALASFALVPRETMPKQFLLSSPERAKTIRWLLQNQDTAGGFRGRTGKEPDACYCFWCGASLEILGVKALINTDALASFVGRCQYKFGGIAKALGEHPDPYHTYLASAAIAINPPKSGDQSWTLQPLDTLINASVATATWAREHVPARKP
ncbi:terpenoid cyclases/Protein prenyltransferase [Dentipellis sp. KUC8613]|nr:terpenoid cyclases/Protein prenyltransferase [Dentipellis sp. KUC8613]